MNIQDLIEQVTQTTADRLEAEIQDTARMMLEQVLEENELDFAPEEIDDLTDLAAKRVLVLVD